MQFFTNLFKSIKIDPSILLQALGVVLGHADSFRVGDKRVTASIGGVPHHLTLGEAEVAITRILAGASSTFSIGSVTVDVEDWQV